MKSEIALPLGWHGILDKMTLFTQPKEVLREQRDAGITEPGNLALLLLFAVMNFFAQLPGQYRIFEGGPKMVENSEGVMVQLDFAQFAGWQAVYSICGVPLVMYGLAALAHYIVSKYGGKATWPEARRAMFLAACVSLPLIFAGAAATWFGIPNLALILSFATLIYFLWYWQQGLNALEFNHV